MESELWVLLVEKTDQHGVYVERAEGPFSSHAAALQHARDTGLHWFTAIEVERVRTTEGAEEVGGD